MSEAESETILIRVTGMTCASCVRRVDRALQAVDGVREVRVQLREGTVRVRRDPAVHDAELVEAVRRAGYDAAVAIDPPSDRR